MTLFPGRLIKNSACLHSHNLCEVSQSDWSLPVLSSFLSNMYQSDGQWTDCGRPEDVPSESETSCDILYLDVTYRCFQEDFLMNGFDVEKKYANNVKGIGGCEDKINLFFCFVEHTKKCFEKCLQSNKVWSSSTFIKISFFVIWKRK